MFVKKIFRTCNGKKCFIVSYDAKTSLPTGEGTTAGAVSLQDLSDNSEPLQYRTSYFSNNSNIY